MALMGKLFSRKRPEVVPDRDFDMGNLLLRSFRKTTGLVRNDGGVVGAAVLRRGVAPYL